MKITDIRTMKLTGPDTHGIGGVPRNITIELVRVDTDAGIYGLGEAGNFMGDREGIAYCREWLLGRDPLAAGQFVRAMLYGGLPPYNPQMSPTATPTGGIAWAASGVEMALLDIAGKALGNAVLQPARRGLPRQDPPLRGPQWRRRSQRPCRVASGGRTGPGRQVHGHEVRPGVGRAGLQSRPVEPVRSHRPDQSHRRTPHGGARRRGLGRRDLGGRAHELSTPTRPSDSRRRSSPFACDGSRIRCRS